MANRSRGTRSTYQDAIHAPLSSHNPGGDPSPPGDALPASTSSPWSLVQTQHVAGESQPSACGPPHIFWDLGRSGSLPLPSFMDGPDQMTSMLLTQQEVASQSLQSFQSSPFDLSSLEDPPMPSIHRQGPSMMNLESQGQPQDDRDPFSLVNWQITLSTINEHGLPPPPPFPQGEQRGRQSSPGPPYGPFAQNLGSERGSGRSVAQGVSIGPQMVDRAEEKRSKGPKQVTTSAPTASRMASARASPQHRSSGPDSSGEPSGGGTNPRECRNDRAKASDPPAAPMKELYHPDIMLICESDDDPRVKEGLLRARQASRIASGVSLANDQLLQEYPKAIEDMRLKIINLYRQGSQGSTNYEIINALRRTPEPEWRSLRFRGDLERIRDHVERTPLDSAWCEQVAIQLRYQITMVDADFLDPRKQHDRKVEAANELQSKRARAAGRRTWGPTCSNARLCSVAGQPASCERAPQFEMLRPAAAAASAPVNGVDGARDAPPPPSSNISLGHDPDPGPGREELPSLPNLHSHLSKGMAAGGTIYGPRVHGLQKLKRHTVTHEFLNKLVAEAEALSNQEKAALARARGVEDKLASVQAQLYQAHQLLTTLTEQGPRVKETTATRQAEPAGANAVGGTSSQARIQGDAKVISALTRRAEVAEDCYRRVSQQLKEERLKRQQQLENGNRASTPVTRAPSSTPSASQIIPAGLVSSMPLPPRGKGKIRKSTSATAQASAMNGAHPEHRFKRSRGQRQNASSNSQPAGQTTISGASGHNPASSGPDTPSQNALGRSGAAPTSSKGDALTGRT